MNCRKELSSVGIIDHELFALLSNRSSHTLLGKSKTSNDNQTLYPANYATSHFGFLSPHQTQHSNRLFVRLVGWLNVRDLGGGSNAFLVWLILRLCVHSFVCLFVRLLVSSWCLLCAGRTVLRAAVFRPTIEVLIAIDSFLKLNSCLIKFYTRACQLI